MVGITVGMVDMVVTIMEDIVMGKYNIIPLLLNW